MGFNISLFTQALEWQEQDEKVTVHILSPKSHNLCFEAFSFPCFLFQTRGNYFAYLSLPSHVSHFCLQVRRPPFPSYRLLFMCSGCQLSAKQKSEPSSFLAFLVCWGSFRAQRTAGQMLTLAVKCSHRAKVKKKPWRCRDLKARWGHQVFSLSKRPPSVYLQPMRWPSANWEEHHQLLRAQCRPRKSHFSSADRLRRGHPPHLAVGLHTLKKDPTSWACKGNWEGQKVKRWSPLPWTQGCSLIARPKLTASKRCPFTWVAAKGDSRLSSKCAAWVWGKARTALRDSWRPWSP